MTDTKSGKVLKKEEVEKGNFGTVVELPYVQVVDEEAEANTQEVTVKFPNETKVTITKIAHSANKESFLVQSIVVKNHILKDLGLFAEAEGHEKEMKKYKPTSTSTTSRRRLSKTSVLNISTTRL
jgi:hypothetical protein